MINLYKVTDTHSLKNDNVRVKSFEVACDNEIEARRTHPNKDIVYNKKGWRKKDGSNVCKCAINEWVSVDELFLLKVEQIGTLNTTVSNVNKIQFWNGKDKK